MKRKQIGEPVLPTDWTGVIDRVQDVLTQTETAAAERERRVADVPLSVPSAKKATAWKDSLEHFENRLRLFQAAFQKAEEDAEEADITLADAEKALQQWLARARESSGKVDQPS